MKPMPQFAADRVSRRHNRFARSPRANGPVTDQHFHSMEQPHSGDGNSRKRSSISPERPSFREISREFFRNEAPPNFWAELFLFGLITLLSSWPVFALVEALAALSG